MVTCHRSSKQNWQNNVAGQAEPEHPDWQSQRFVFLGTVCLTTRIHTDTHPSTTDATSCSAGRRTAVGVGEFKHTSSFDQTLPHCATARCHSLPQCFHPSSPHSPLGGTGVKGMLWDNLIRLLRSTAATKEKKKKKRSTRLPRQMFRGLQFSPHLT